MANPQIVDADFAAGLIKEHDRLMCGGFLVAGAAQNLIDALVKIGTKNLHLIAISPDWDDRGVGKLLVNKQIKTAQFSWHGACQASQAQFKNKELKIEFNPQGILMERIRAAGAGLGGIFSPVGLETVIEKERDTIEVGGQKYILETPIKADFSFIRAYKADKKGNLIYWKTARNSNPIMAMAAKVTIVEVDEIVEIGELDPEVVVTPGLFVNYIVEHKE